MHIFARLSPLLPAALVAGLLGLAGCGSDASPAPAVGNGRVDLDLGVIRAGSRAEGRLQVRNSSARAWRVAQVESSCPCLTVRPTAFAVGPGATVTLAVTCDLAAEPEFRGALGVEVVAKGAAGDTIWTRHVAVSVTD